ncbi:MAG: ABC transporter ATP-binding protein [Gemmataceae bacterium]
MKNFVRALRFAWPYRYRLGFSIVCAFLAAAVWGLNISAIYPFLKLLGNNSNLQEWANNSIAEQERLLEPLEAEHARIQAEEAALKDLAAGPERDTKHRKLTERLARVESKMNSARWHQYLYQVAKRYIDAYLPTDQFKALVFVLVAVFCGVLVRSLLEYMQDTAVGSVVNRSLFDIRNLFFRRAIHYDVANFHDNGTNQIVSRLATDVDIIGNGMKVIFGRVLAEPMRAAACVTIACFISWRLTLLFLILVPLAGYTLSRVGRLMKRATKRVLEQMSSIFKILQETFHLDGIKVIKGFGREAQQRKRFREATMEYYRKSMRVVRLDAFTDPMIQLLGVAAIFGALLVGAYVVINKRTEVFGITLADQPLEMESLLQLYALLLAISDPVRKLASVYTKIQAGMAASDRVFEFIDRENKVSVNAQGPMVPRHQRDIEFHNVCFRYSQGRDVLNGVNLRVRHGEIIAIVGKNGCGKTTLLSMLPRFHDPDHGTIRIDGVDITQANLRSLRKQIGVVTQEPFLFDDTVYNNIAYGRPSATREEVEEAARQAHAHELILSLTHGYDTRVGELGKNLSGGQKQRLSLARAILSNPTILILDEATSQADAESEMEIHRILREFMKGRTSFIITHRLNTLEIADRIVVIDGGVIAAEGSHEELLRISPLYQRLSEAHFLRRVA